MIEPVIQATPVDRTRSGGPGKLRGAEEIALYREHFRQRSSQQGGLAVTVTHCLPAKDP